MFQSAETRETKNNAVAPGAAHQEAIRSSGSNRRGRPLRNLSVSAFAVIGILGLVACGGSAAAPGVASVGSTSAAVPSSSATGGSSGTPAKAEAQPLRYSQCMRSHGIADYPDPSGNGSVTIHVRPGGDLNPNSPQNQAAQAACKSVRPGGNLTLAQEAAANAKALSYSQCIRSHGIGDFPDPNGQGTLTINEGSGDLDPNSARFEVAEKACQSLDTGFNTNENNLSPPPAAGQGSGSAGQ
jgi:hypothetical protein